MVDQNIFGRLPKVRRSFGERLRDAGTPRMNAFGKDTDWISVPEKRIPHLGDVIPDRVVWREARREDVNAGKSSHSQTRRPMTA